MNYSFRIGGKTVKVRTSWESHPKLYLPIQKHTSRVIVLRTFPYPPVIGDGVLTDLEGVEIGVRTADCVPLVLIGEEWIGAVHIGWRGLASGIVERAVEVISGYEDLKKVFAFIGPAAKGCCYEVGEEFRDMFDDLIERDGRIYMDLQESVLRRLRKAGIGSVGVYERCTVCSPDLPSYRRDRTSVRILTSVRKP
ncbi:MAG: polyphenol oxidase family protein [Aquificota bacterium]|nr:polyphenol oxidase family protein [Aquificota bacterium]MDQ7081616.1 polyphenol oxidase family protein [Aquificota bacterium]